MLYTETVLSHALARGRATVPRYDGVTYRALRLLQRIPGNPLLGFTTFAIVIDTGHLSGPAASLSPFLKLVRILIDLFPSRFASVR